MKSRNIYNFCRSPPSFTTWSRCYLYPVCLKYLFIINFTILSCLFNEKSKFKNLKFMFLSLKTEDNFLLHHELSEKKFSRTGSKLQFFWLGTEIHNLAGVPFLKISRAGLRSAELRAQRSRKFNSGPETRK
jgi:hypothetical protein